MAVTPALRFSNASLVVSAVVLGACAGAPAPEPAPTPSPSPPPIAIPAETPSPPAAANVAFDAALLDLVVVSSPAGEPSLLRFDLIASRIDRRRRNGLLEVETSTGWRDQARATGTEANDPAAALLDAVNGAGPISLDALETPALGEGYALVLRTRSERIDFATGVGIRYLAAFTDDYAPLTDDDLYYLFEGLTRDGRYHLQMVLPIASSVLPDIPEPGTLESAVEFAGISDVYLDLISDELANAAAQGFSPSLERLDAFVRSIAVR